MSNETKSGLSTTKVFVDPLIPSTLGGTAVVQHFIDILRNFTILEWIIYSCSGHGNCQQKRFLRWNSISMENCISCRYCLLGCLRLL